MLRQIPTHLLTGSLGVGKSTTLQKLFKQKPDHERWAVLINEFGQIGLDQALLSTDQSGVSLSEVAGGCVCCVNGAPFQVALARLLKHAKPSRLFIEPSGLGHQRQLYKQLLEQPWDEVLNIQPLVIIAEANPSLSINSLPQQQQDLLPLAGLLVVNKAEQINLQQQQLIRSNFAELDQLKVVFCTQGQLDFQQLPGNDQHVANTDLSSDAEITSPTATGTLWLDPSRPICAVQNSENGWSIGWRWHKSQQFDLMRLQFFLQQLPFIRAKLVANTNAGWLSANAVENQSLHWQTSGWQEDSRIELIFNSEQPSEQLQNYLAACRVT